MSDSDLAEYAYLWDPANGWSLISHFHEQARLKVIFESKPTLEQLKTARAILPLMPKPTLKEFFARYSNCSEIDVGILITRHALGLQVKCESEGLKTVVTNESYVDYYAENKQLSRALIIEDNEIAQRVYKKMKAAGLPVVEIIGD